MDWIFAILVVLGVVALVSWRLRAAPVVEELPVEEPAPPVPLPIALLHGAFGFDEVVVRRERHAYFRGVADRLRGHGWVVHCPAVAPVAGVARRADELAVQLRALPEGRVHLIAHSMGGLDARYAIAHLGLADRVASLVTIGTPHRGTPLADLGHSVASRIGLRTVLGSMSDLVADLTTERMEEFNREVPNVDGVRYASVIGRVTSDTPMHPLLVPIHAWMRRHAGDSDGLVPTTSQAWGEVLLTVDADHWAQVGWSTVGYDTPAIYEQIAVALGQPPVSPTPSERAT